MAYSLTEGMRCSYTPNTEKMGEYTTETRKGYIPLTQTRSNNNIYSIYLSCVYIITTLYYH